MNVNEPVLLGAYDAKRCARRIHNEWDPTLERVDRVVPADVQMRLDAGIAFEDTVLDRLREALGPERYVDLSGLGGSGPNRQAVVVEATLAAMAVGAEVIIGSWLPDDPAGGRKGRPDLLVRDGDGYVPGEVKAHLMVKASRRGTLEYSRPAEPAVVTSATGWVARTSQRLNDFLQLAHYWRMLEACGHAAATPRCFVIGTDTVSDLDPGPLLVWHDLTSQQFSTFSRSRGSARRSALERYDHEHDFRVLVAGAAAARTGTAADPTPVVVPIFTHECDGCAWREHCLEVAGPETASALITTGSLTHREWLALGRLGYASLSELARLDLDDERFLTGYLPEVTHLPDATERLAKVVRRARMIDAGVDIDRTTTGPVSVPRADIEIDFDIEWGVDQRVYLYGVLVRRPGATPSYQPIVAWDPLDDTSERALAERFVSWLRTLVTDAGESGQTVRLYHYSPVEVNQLKRVLGGPAVQDLIPLFVDLHVIVAANFFGAHGLGIKKVAPHFGFGWRDEDPSGLLSQLWLQEAQDLADPVAAEQARQRLLEYNEDDVAATAALRAGLAGLG